MPAAQPSARYARRQGLAVGDYLALIGELSIGVAGFSGVVAALSQRSAGEWRPVDVLRFQMLIRQSVAVAMGAVFPALLLSAGLSGPMLWRGISGLWLLITPVAIARLMQRGNAVISANPEDTSRPLYFFVTAVPVASVLLQVANVSVVASPWPHLATLTLGLLVAALLFVRLATVAFTSARPGA